MRKETAEVRIASSDARLLQPPSRVEVQATSRFIAAGATAGELTHLESVAPRGA